MLLIFPLFPFCGALPTSLFPSPSLRFYSPSFQLLPSRPSVSSLLFHISSLHPSFCPTFSSSFAECTSTVSVALYNVPLPLSLSQGSLLEATVFGLEPYSHYSLRVEAVNGAGGFILTWFLRPLLNIIWTQGEAEEKQELHEYPSAANMWSKTITKPSGVVPNCSTVPHYFHHFRP